MCKLYVHCVVHSVWYIYCIHYMYAVLDCINIRQSPKHKSNTVLWLTPDNCNTVALHCPEVILLKAESLGLINMINVTVVAYLW